MPGDQTLSPPLLGAIIANMLIDLMLPQTRVSQLQCYRTMCMNISILLGVVQVKVTRSRQNSEKYTLLGFNKFIRGYRISHQSKGHNATFSYQWLIVTSAVSRTVSELRRLICKYRLWDISVFHLPPFVSGNYVPFEYIHELCTPKKLDTLRQPPVETGSSYVYQFLPERDYVTFGSLLSQFRLSSVCLSSVTLVHPTQEVEAFGNISSPLCTVAIL